MSFLFFFSRAHGELLTFQLLVTCFSLWTIARPIILDKSIPLGHLVLRLFPLAPRMTRVGCRPQAVASRQSTNRCGLPYSSSSSSLYTSWQVRTWGYHPTWTMKLEKRRKLRIESPRSRRDYFRASIKVRSCYPSLDWIEPLHHGNQHGGFV